MHLQTEFQQAEKSIQGASELNYQFSTVDQALSQQQHSPAEHSEQDGNFDDLIESDDNDEVEEELMAFEERFMNGGTVAYKASKRADNGQLVSSAHFDFDAFDESLQKQWQNDRAKKALKRQERYLKRLEAQPTKLNRKKAKRAGASADPWHLLDDGGQNSTLEPDFHRIDAKIRLFVENTSRAEFALPPMDKKFRYAVHMLADAYR